MVSFNQIQKAAKINHLGLRIVAGGDVPPKRSCMLCNTASVPFGHPTIRSDSNRLCANFNGC